MFERFFLDMGFSFTFSKLLPYILAVVLGFLIVYFLRKRLRTRNRVLTFLLRFVVFAVPFVVYFIFYPIYEGDFSNGSTQVARSVSNQEISGKKLYVLTIPYCPYCEEAIGNMHLLKSRNKNIEIEYIVCSEDSSTMKFYQDAGMGDISVRLAKDPKEMSVLATGHFPTFVLSEEGKDLRRWSNSTFGVCALDEVEETFQ